MKLVLKIAGAVLLVWLLLVTGAFTAHVLCSPEVHLLKLVWRALISA